MHRNRSHAWTLFMAAVVVVFTVLLVLYPEQGFHAAVGGLKVFWDVVFPSLLPFFVLSELLLGLGVVSALGVLLEPLMRPLFSVPGVGAFALSMGLAAGYPMDAVITARFRQQDLCSRIEGERMLAFTNTADPLFMFGAVAVGMFKAAAVGIALAIAHYASSFVVGVTYKFYGRSEERRLSPAAAQHRGVEGHLLRRSVHAMMAAKNQDGRAFGKLLGDAVTDSLRTLLMIGGFIMFFAVFIRILEQVGALALAALPLRAMFAAIGLAPTLVQPLLAGIFEIDIGSAAAAAANAPLIERLSVVSAIIAWSGLSVHAQVASVLTKTDIRMRPYFIARAYHAVLAALFTFALLRLGVGTRLTFAPRDLAAMAPLSGDPQVHYAMVGLALSTATAVLGCALCLSIAIYAARRVRLHAFYARPRSE